MFRVSVNLPRFKFRDGRLNVIYSGVGSREFVTLKLRHIKHSLFTRRPNIEGLTNLLGAILGIIMAERSAAASHVV